MAKRVSILFYGGVALLLAGCAGDPVPAPAPADAGTADAAPLQPACEAPRSHCGAECSDLATDPEHCGSCATRCAPDKACTDGACTSPCGPGLLACDGTCIDPASERAHCGGCGRACSGDERCTRGACSACVARSLPEQLPIAVEFDTRGAGDRLHGSCGPGSADELAFAWRAPHAGKFRFSSEGSRFNTVLYVLAGDCGGEELGCSDDRRGALSSLLELDLAQHEDVVVVIDGFEGQAGQGSLHIDALDASTCCGDSNQPGCGVSAVEACVCAIDEFCCSLAWDELCVAAVNEAGCGACAEPEAPPCEPAASSADASASLAGEIGSSDHAEASCGGPIGTPDVLLGYTAPAAGTYSFDTAGSQVTDTVLAVLDGSACDGAELGCNDDSGNQLSSRVRVALAAGQTVLLVVEGWEGERGAATVAVAREDAAALRCEPSRMAGALPLSARGQTSPGASALEPSCALFGSAGETLFSFTAPEAGRYRFDTAGSTADTLLQVLDGDCAGDELGCNDDPDENSLAAALELSLAAAQTVLVNLDSVIGEGDYVLTITRAGDSSTP